MPRHDPAGALRRRQMLIGGTAWAIVDLTAAAADPLEAALRGPQGAGSVLMLRHALAPGTFDPPEFRLGDCSTQRNLDATGRRQAERIGAWFGPRGLRPSRVRSSPWCRCVDTARLAFGERVDVWPALGSPHGGETEANARAIAALRAGLVDVARRRAGFEVWVTHMFVFSALLGEGAGSGDGALLAPGDDGAPRVLLRVSGLAG